METYEDIILDRIMTDGWISLNEYHLNWFENWFYRIKTILCVLLGLINSEATDDYITVLCVESSTWYGGWDAYYACVGKASAVTGGTAFTLTETTTYEVSQGLNSMGRGKAISSP